MNKSLDVIIGGDIVPTKGNYKLFEEGDVDTLLSSELYDIIKQADIHIANLETPLFDGDNCIEKYGPCLKAPTSTIKGISKICPNVISIANNHILDHGVDGLNVTLNMIESEGIVHIGAGADVGEASKPFIYKADASSIGIYSCCEHEFSCAGASTAGANPIDVYRTFDDIRELKEKCEFIIVLFHGGKELYRYPTPGQQKICRMLVDAGANVVICQHSHCIGCQEVYRSSTIVYGQGNYIFDDGDSEYLNNSLLVKITISKSGYSVRYIPIVKKKSCIELANDYDSKIILKEFYERSKVCSDDAALIEKFHRLATDSVYNYIVPLVPGSMSLPFRILNRITHGTYSKLAAKIYFNKAKRVALRNFIECETHREILSEITKL